MRKLNDSFSSVAIASCESSTWSPSTIWSSTSGVKTRQLRSQANGRTFEAAKPLLRSQRVEPQLPRESRPERSRAAATLVPVDHQRVRFVGGGERDCPTGWECRARREHRQSGSRQRRGERSRLRGGIRKDVDAEGHVRLTSGSFVDRSVVPGVLRVPLAASSRAPNSDTALLDVL